MNKQEEKIRELSYFFCEEKSCNGISECKNCPRAIIHPALKEISEWMKEQLINWLKENKNHYIRIKSMKTIVDDSILEDLKKSMEE